jgi:thiol-disulfide isomerase/thioredoxin
MRALRLTASLAAVAAALLLSSTARADVLKVGDRLAELDVATDGNGKPVKLKSYKGKWVVVTVGADWCKPCAKELPTWDKLAGELRGKVVFVAVDIDDEIDVGKKFHDKLKLRNMVRAYLPSEKSGVAGNYGSDHMPATFVGDPQGVVRLVREGFEAGDSDGEYKKFKDQLARLVK